MSALRASLALLFTVTFGLSPLVTRPFAGFRPDQLPIPQVNPPIQPAGYAFSIWGLIYGWLLVSAVYGIWRRRENAAWERVRGPLILSLICGTPWLAVANASAIWATVLIWVMGATAIAALLRTPKRDRWWLRVPVGLYAGWLTAASFVALGATLAGYGIGPEAVGWAYIGIGGALVVALAVLWRGVRSPAYGLAVIWALIGIVVANYGSQTGVALMAGAGILCLGFTIAWRAWR